MCLLLFGCINIKIKKYYLNIYLNKNILKHNLYHNILKYINTVKRTKSRAETLRTNYLYNIF
jgi:predicted nucleotidyltransferase